MGQPPPPGRTPSQASFEAHICCSQMDKAQNSVLRLSNTVCMHTRWLPVACASRGAMPRAKDRLQHSEQALCDSRLLLSQLHYSRPKKLRCPRVFCNVLAASSEHTLRWRLTTPALRVIPGVPDAGSSAHGPTHPLVMFARLPSSKVQPKSMTLKCLHKLLLLSLRKHQPICRSAT